MERKDYHQGRKELVLPPNMCREVEFLYDKPFMKRGVNRKTGVEFDYYYFTFKDLKDGKEYYKMTTTTTHLAVNLIQYNKGDQVQICLFKQHSPHLKKMVDVYEVSFIGKNPDVISKYDLNRGKLAPDIENSVVDID